MNTINGQELLRGTQGCFNESSRSALRLHYSGAFGSSARRGEARNVTVSIKRQQFTGLVELEVYRFLVEGFIGEVISPAFRALRRPAHLLLCGTSEYPCFNDRPESLASRFPPPKQQSGKPKRLSL